MKSRLLLASSLSALCLAPVASVRAQSSSTDEVGGIIVSASRINLSGYQQPTPVTVVDVVDMQRDAQTNLGGIFRALPSFGVTNSPDTYFGAQTVSNGGGGAENIALRDLSPERTLVLINGVRAVGTELVTPAVDLGMIPSMLIQRIDVVTGGASAAWGSDAVAGVVNIVMNDKFDGFEGNVEGANNQWLTKVTGKAEIAYGTSFLQDRGRFILGLQYLNSPLTPLLSEARWRTPGDYIALMNNPAYTATNGQPQLITVHNVGFSTKASGGLIASGPLKGIQFVGPQGTPRSFNFGNVSGAFCFACDGQDPIVAGQSDLLSVPMARMALYNRNTYDITDALRAQLEFNATRVSLHNSSITSQRDVPIRIDNAYLDPSIVALMQARGVTQFTLGTTNQNNLPLFADPNTKTRNQIGNLQARSVRYMLRGVAGLEADVGGHWTANANIQYSTSWRHAIQYNGIHVPRYNLAIDAIRVTAANVGASGLPIGSIACRSTVLIDPANGCVPLNVLGDGVASQAAIDYVNPAPGKPLAQYNDIRLKQFTGSVSLTGEAFDLPAGAVATAIGFDYRHDSTLQTANPEAYLSQYASGNFQFFDAGAGVEEGFAEINAPLLKNQAIQSLDVNGAARVTHYAHRGTVVTWKGGAVAQLNDDLRLRGSLSRDIRAPSLYQLFNPGAFGASAAPIPGQSPANLQSGGNANLDPEKATTWIVGTVLTPRFIPGLSVSADWYDITIKGVFFSPNSQQVYAQCQLGNQAFCALMTRAGDGTVTLVRQVPINASRQIVNGLDVQADYTFEALKGEFALGVLASYVHSKRLTTPVSDYETAGSRNLDLGGSDQPKLKSTMRLTYTQGPYSGTVQSRFFGKSKVNNQYHEGGGPGSIDNNLVPYIAYLDLRASFNFGPGGNWQVYAAVDNVLDVDPALIPSNSLQLFAGFFPPTSAAYDLLGRSYRYGVRVRF